MRGACYFSHARSATAVPLDGRRSPCSRERVPLAPLLLAAHLVLAVAPPASPSLPPGHWAVDAARRLHELGLAPDFLPAQRAVPLLVVGRTLAEAADRARETAPAYAPLASAWAARFAEEFSGTSEGRGEAAGLRLLSAHATLGYQDGATSELPSASPPLPAALHLEAPRPDPFAELGAAASLGPHLAAGLTARATPWQVDLPFAELVAAVGPVALSIGRAPLRYGPNEVGGVVATGATVDRVEAMTTAPIRLPGVLAALGDFALDLAVARFDEPRHPYHPLLWDMQLSWRPHLTLGALRGVMFGGALWEGIPTSQIPLALFGPKNYRENNVYSGTIEYRLPTERLLPLTAKLEWGTDDNPAAAFSWPGLVAGLSSPMLPGLPVAVGFEYAYFGKGPFGYHDPFPWYSHGQSVGGWATGEHPARRSAGWERPRLAAGGVGRAVRRSAAAHRGGLAAGQVQGQPLRAGRRWPEPRRTPRRGVPGRALGRGALGRGRARLGRLEPPVVARRGHGLLLDRASSSREGSDPTAPLATVLRPGIMMAQMGPTDRAVDVPKLKAAFEALDARLSSDVTLVVGGGSAMMLGYGLPVRTTDVDAYPISGRLDEIAGLVQEVGREVGLSQDWLNPYFETFAHVLPSDYGARLKEVFAGKRLRVMVLGVEDLLIMKCFAGREKDVGHARALLRRKPDLGIVERRIEELLARGVHGAADAADFLDDLAENG
jgi:hypothetical protein